MSRSKEARPRTRPADPCAFCGARVPRRRPADGEQDGPEPGLCQHCDAGDSIQFKIRETFELAKPFAHSRWRQADLVDAGAPLRFGVEPRRRANRQ